MTKKILMGMSAIAMLFATSCQDDMNLPGNVGETTTVAFNVSMPEIGTRAYSDGQTATVLQYAVYEGNVELDKLTKSVVKGNAETINTSKEVQLQLTTGNEYTVIFWAAAPNAPYTVNFADKTMIVDYSAEKTFSNDERRDAFYAAHTFTVSGAQTEMVELKRPFAQLNIGTSDYTQATNAGYTPTHSSVTVNDVYTILNLATGDIDKATKTSASFGMAPIKNPNATEEEEFPVAGYKYLAMNYFLVDADKETVEVTFAYGESDDINEAKTRTVGSVPVQRNYRTNIYGKLLTSMVDINVEIVPDYEGDEDYNEDDNRLDVWDGTIEEVSEIDGVYTITKASQLAWIISSGQHFSNKVIRLANNLDLDNIEWLSNNYSEPFAGTFDGQGHTIYNLKSTRDLGHGLFRRVYEGTVKNLNISQAYISNDNWPIGVICGDLAMNSNIENCSVIDSEISSGGGICGMNGTGPVSIKNCRVENIKITGGGGRSTGGICGNILAAGSIIDGCFVSNSYITGAGGICGYSYGGKIINCNVENSLVIGEDDVDDIVGVNMGSISNCKSDDVTTYNKKLKECYVANAYGLDWISRNINSQRPNKNPMFDGSTIKFVDDIQSVSDNSVVGSTFYQASMIQRGGIIDGCNKELMVLYREKDPRAEQFGIASYGGEIKNLTIKSNIPPAGTIFRPIILYAPVEDVIASEVEDVIIENVYLDSGSSPYGLSMPATGTIYDDI